MLHVNSVKSKILTFPDHGDRASTCFDIIYIDVWGICTILSHVQYKYVVTFIDDYNCLRGCIFSVPKLNSFLPFKFLLLMLKLTFPLALKYYFPTPGRIYVQRILGLSPN